MRRSTPSCMIWGRMEKGRKKRDKDGDRDEDKNKDKDCDCDSATATATATVVGQAAAVNGGGEQREQRGAAVVSDVEDPGRSNDSDIS